MSTDRDDATMRRYREANAALDEGPSAATRAAILAAAARHVEAKPRAADAPRAAHRRRWPVAAAAAVLLSTLAVMMAQRTQQEMPTFTAPAEQSQAKVAAATPEPAPAAERAKPGSMASPPASQAPGSPSRTSGTNEVSADSRERAEVSAAAGARMNESTTARASGDGVTAESRAPVSRDAPPAIAADAATSRSKAAVEQETAGTEVPRSFPAAPTAALAPPPPPPAAEKPSAAVGAAGGAGDAARSDASPAYRAARKEAAPAAPPVAQGVVRQEAQREVELSAPEWLDRIVKLRGEGRHAEADAELKRFRERYPGVQVPPAALPPAVPLTGTR